MNFEKNSISGLCVITPRVFDDPRGYFFESYSKKSFVEAGITDDFVQSNQSLSQKGVLRGLHFQAPPHAQSKLVRVIQGAVLDVAVDVRKNSPTYGQHFSIVLSEQNKKMFYVPVGFAHGFLTLEDNTIFSYKCGNYYNKASELGILWNDATLNIDWGIKEPLLSEKDKVNSLFRDFDSPFIY
jgi:dTDP-4-dehydrorhamnose 3,5-epimerase